MSETTQDGAKPDAGKTIKWHGDGIYSKTRTGRDGNPRDVYYVRLWVPSEHKMRTWKLRGRTLDQAKRNRLRIGDPDKAAAALMAAHAERKRAKVKEGETRQGETNITRPPVGDTLKGCLFVGFYILFFLAGIWGLFVILGRIGRILQ